MFGMEYHGSTLVLLLDQQALLEPLAQQDQLVTQVQLGQLEQQALLDLLDKQEQLGPQEQRVLLVQLVLQVLQVQLA